MGLHLREAVRQPAHPDHQRRRRAGLALDVAREFLTGHTDARGEFLRLETGPAEQHPNLACDFSALVGFQVFPGAGQHFGQCLRNPIRPCRLQHLLDLARGPAVRIALDGDDDALPYRQVVGFQCLADRGRRPELHRLVVIGRAARPLRRAGRYACGGSVAARVHSHRHLASSSIATATDRHRSLTLAQSASASGPDIGMSNSSDGCGSASRRTSCVATHCFLDGSPQ